MDVLGRVPEKDDHFEYKNLQVTVLEMDDKRVDQVRIVVDETKTENEKE